MITYVLIILAVVVAGVVIATKFGFVKDEDKNGVPDAVEEKVAEVKAKVEDVKKEVVKRANMVKEEAKQAVKAAGRAPRKGRKPKQ